MPIIYGQAGSPQTSGKPADHILYDHYAQYNLLIKNLPLSAQTNNYLIKLIFPLYKTGLQPGPANFPVIIFPKIHVHDSVVGGDDLP